MINNLDLDSYKFSNHHLLNNSFNVESEGQLEDSFNDSSKESFNVDSEEHNEESEDKKLAKDVFIAFASTLPKDTFVSFFLDVIDDTECGDYIINDIIKICIEDATYRSINVLIWMIYSGYIKDEKQYEIIEDFINELDDNDEGKSKILELIEDSKNNRIDNKYYKNLLKEIEYTF